MSYPYPYGDCYFCGGEVQEEIVELDYRFQGQLYLFESVPAGVCRQCGEKYFKAEIAKKLENAARSPENIVGERRVPVLMLK